MNYENHNKLIDLVLKKGKRSTHLKEAQEDITAFKNVSKIMDSIKQLKAELDDIISNKYDDKVKATLDRMIEKDTIGGGWIKTLNDAKAAVDAVINIKKSLETADTAIKTKGRFFDNIMNDKRMLRDIREA